MQLRWLLLSRPDLGAGQAPPHARVHDTQVHAPGPPLSNLCNVFLVHLLKARAQALLQLRRTLRKHADQRSTHMQAEAPCMSGGSKGTVSSLDQRRVPPPQQSTFGHYCVIRRRGH